jgi:diguanylate cyclase (GGDEF)-like protein
MTNTADDPIACDLFEFAPISLWEEDYSGVKAYLDQLRAAGVTDLGAHLAAHPQAVGECMARIQVINVNRKTVELFRASSKRELLDNLEHVFRDEMGAHFAGELLAMWDGQAAWVGEGINYALDGQPLEIRLHWSVLPGSEASLSRVLVSIEDVTAHRQAERAHRQAEQARAASEARFRGLFENAPVSLWEEDYTGIKRFLDDLRAQNVADLGQYLVEHPEAVDECMARIKVLYVNQKTLDLLHAKTKPELLASLGQVFRDEMRAHFRTELVHLWEGRLSDEVEGINYALNGEPVNIQLQWAVLPGSESSLEHVLISMEDITARKKAEDYLKYLGTHDVLTGLYNRAYFEEELARLGRGRQFPISLIVADLDGLKGVNDTRGHSEGDKLIRRAAEVLQASVRAEDIVTRIGGDEFALLLPSASAAAAEQALTRIRSLIELNNKYYSVPVLNLSLGAATGELGGSLGEVLRQADDQMYVEKRQHHGR